MKNDIRRNTRHIAFILIGLMAVLCVYACYSVYFYGGRWFASPYNARIRAVQQQVTPGDILDRTGVILATTDASGTRDYPGDPVSRRSMSHILGDTRAQVPGGTETFHAGYLLGFNASVFDRIADLFSAQGRRGDDVYLTVDADLQRYAHDAFPARRDGAAVILNYRTGEVLLMYSKPEFDPAAVNRPDYEPEGSELVNRATQGRYAPGSVFKTVTAAAALDYLADARDIAFDCEGLYGDGDRPIKDGAAHGTLDLAEAFARSCNVYFGRLALQVGEPQLRRTARQAAFDDDFLFRDLMVSASALPAGQLDAASLMWAGVGQDAITVTPMHMAMIAGAAANRGEMMEPTVIRQVTASGGGVIRTLTARSYRRAFGAGTADILKEMMIATVGSGTGTGAALKGYTVGGKTGTAQVSDTGAKEPHAWFIGFIDDEAAPLCIAVVIENGGSGGEEAAPLAGKLLGKAAEVIR